MALSQEYLNCIKSTDMSNLGGIDFTIPSLKKDFHAILQKNGIPESATQVISAKENQEYLGQYSSHSVFKSTPKFHLHVLNHFEDHHLTPKELTIISEKTAESIHSTIMETLVHEYMHSIYDLAKNSSEINTRNAFNSVQDAFTDEEDFAETIAVLMVDGTLNNAKDSPDQYIYDRQLQAGIEIINAFNEEIFFPEDVLSCGNSDTKQEFLQRSIQHIVTANINKETTLSEMKKIITQTCKTANNHFKEKFSLTFTTDENEQTLPIIKIDFSSTIPSKEFFYIDIRPKYKDSENHQRIFSHSEIVDKIISEPKKKKSYTT